MIKISQIVEELLIGNETAMESLRMGILNLSSFAELIRPEIEKRLYKKVRKGTIVTALSRKLNKRKLPPPLRATIKIEDLGIKSPLCELTYEKTRQTVEEVAKISADYFGRGFFTSTQSISEVSLIISESIHQEIKKRIPTIPKGEYSNLSAITVRFDESEYLEVPNMIYTLMSVLAGKRINIIELVSTFTEISLVVRQKDLSETVEVLKNNFLN